MFQKPTAKTVVNPIVMGASFIGGAKVGDGIAAVMPESVQPYRRLIVGALGVVLAASVKATTTAGVAAQAAFVGMAAKQGLDEVNERLTAAVEKKTDNTTTSKFLNAVVGHQLGSPDVNYIDWQPADESAIDLDQWSRPEAEPMMIEFSGV